MAGNSTIRIVNIPDGFPTQFVNTDGNVYLQGVPPLELSKNRRLLSELNSIETDGIFPFTLPYTPLNDRILRSFVSPHILNNGYAPLQIVLSICGVESSLYTGLCVRSGNDNSRQYEVVLTKATHWLECMSNLRLCDLDLGYFEFTEANVRAEWANGGFYNDGGPGYWFPLINLCQLLNNVDGVPLDHFRPHFHLLKLAQDAFCECGFNFSSEWWESDFGRRALAYLSNYPIVNQDNLSGYTFRVGLQNDIIIPAGLGSSNIDFDDDTSDGFFDSGGDFAAGYYDTVASEAARLCGRHSFRLTLAIQTNTPQAIRIVINRLDGTPILVEYFFQDILHTGTGIETFVIEGPVWEMNGVDTVTTVLNFQGGVSVDDIFINVEGSFFENIPESACIDEGSLFPVNSFIDCDLRGTDLIKAMAHEMNGRIVECSADNTIELVPLYDVEYEGVIYDGFVGSNEDHIDITDLVICDSAQKQTPKNKLARYCRLKWADSTDDYIETLGYYGENQLYSNLIDFGENSSFTNETEKKPNPLFEPTADDFFETITPAGENPINVPVYCDGDRDNDDVSTNIGYRRLQAIGYVEQDFQVLATGTNIPRQWIFNGNAVPETFVPWATMGTTVTHSDGIQVADDLSYEKIYNLFYTKELENRQYSAPWEYLVLMNYKDYLRYNFRQKFYFIYDGQPYFMEATEINDWLDSGGGVRTATPMTFIPDIQRDCET